MRLIRRLSQTVAALSVLTAAAAHADTYALVTINQQALFFNQINDGAKEAAAAAGVEEIADLILAARRAAGADAAGRPPAAHT